MLAIILCSNLVPLPKDTLKNVLDLDTKLTYFYWWICVTLSSHVRFNNYLYVPLIDRAGDISGQSSTTQSPIELLVEGRLIVTFARH